MKRKIVMWIMVLCLSILCTACGKSDISVDNVPTTLPNIDESAITTAIKQSTMADAGYRFANAEFEAQCSVYATYYIRSAKECAGTSQSPIDLETKNKIIEKFLNTPNLDLTDIFCAISLLEDNEDLLTETKQKISSYLDRLYDKNRRCYVLHNSNQNDDYLSDIYANYLVYTIANLLDIEIFPIVDWLEKAIQDIFNIKSIAVENSSAYSMLLELSKDYNLEVPQKSIISIIQMLESSLDTLPDLEKKGIYIPVFLMDYMDFCKFANNDNTKNFSRIIRVLCDDNGIKENTFIENDVYGLYATTRTLSLARYNFQNYTSFEDIFNKFNSFMLSDDLYLSPGYVESNLVDTYYADALLHNLNIKASNDIREYCIANKNQILESDILNIYYYLELLQRNNLLEIVGLERKNIIQKLSSALNTLVTDTEDINANLSTINGSIKGLKILGESIEVSEENFNSILENFSENQNQQQEVYDLNKLVEFICLVSPNNKSILQEYCKQLEELSIKLSSVNATNKIMLQSMALNVFEKANYTITTELQQIIRKTLRQAQDNNGLFKGGDSNEDVVSFRNTYDAVVLYEKLI